MAGRKQAIHVAATPWFGSLSVFLCFCALDFCLLAYVPFIC
jgi:hypothetical protein